MPLRQISVLVPEDELQQLRKTAKAKGISANEYIRRAIAIQLTYERWAEPRREDAARVDREDT